MRRCLTIAMALLVAGVSAARADSLLLQQNLPGNVAGAPFLLLERDRISHVEVEKDTSLSHRLTIHLATDPPTVISLVCNDEAITRQVLDALRRGAAPTLDITGRCRL